MRVQIVGQTEAAKSLRGHLTTLSDLAVVDSGADFIVQIREERGEYVTVDGVDGHLEGLVVTYLAEEMGNVLVKRGGGNRRDDLVVVGIPEGQDQPVERGLFRALSGGLAGKRSEKDQPVWWKRRLW